MCIIKLSESIFSLYKVAEISNQWIHLYISDNCLNDIINDCLQLDISRIVFVIRLRQMTFLYIVVIRRETTEFKIHV